MQAGIEIDNSRVLVPHVTGRTDTHPEGGRSLVLRASQKRVYPAAQIHVSVGFRESQVGGSKIRTWCVLFRLFNDELKVFVNRIFGRVLEHPLKDLRVPQSRMQATVLV